MKYAFRGAVAACLLSTTGISLPAVAEEVIEEVVVTGTYLKRSAENSPSPLAVVQQEAFENIGATEISDLVNTLPYNSGSTNQASAFNGGDNNTGNTNINLRNLGLGSTLVLINGKRTVGANFDGQGNAYVDVSNLIPSIAIERMEVVLDGTSSLYGSDAVAGVVNFITRSDFEGLELKIQGSTDTETEKQDDLLIQGIAGITGDRGSATIAASYLDRKPLSIGDRYDRFGQTGLSSVGNPPTVFPLDPTARTDWLLSAIPVTGRPQFGDLNCEQFAPESFIRSNTFCGYDFSSFFALVGDVERYNVSGNANYQLGGSVEYYGDFFFTDDSFKRDNSLFPDVTFPLVNPNHPGYALEAQRRGQTPSPSLLYYRAAGGFIGDDLPDKETRNSRNALRLSNGFRGDIADTSWTWDASYTYSQRRARSRNTDTLTQQTDLALNGFGGPACNPIDPAETAGSGNLGTGDCYWFNPFSSARITPDGQPQTDPLYLNPDELLSWIVGETRTEALYEQDVFDLVFAGDLFEFNGRMTGLAFGGQYRRDRGDVDVNQNLEQNNFKFAYGAQDWDGELKSWAIFGELYLPLTDTLEANLAVRYEDFDTLNEDSIDPKISLMWSATETLTLRGSAGTSFRTPSLLQAFGNSTSLLNMNDPFDGSTVFRPQIVAPNEDLEPESSTNFNLGLSWRPGNFGLDMDYWNYDYQDILTRQSFQELINQDCAVGPACGALPDQVIRGDTGFLQRVNVLTVNAQELQASGVDTRLTYNLFTERAGTFLFSLDWVWMAEYDLTTANGTKIDGVGSRNAANTVGRSLPEHRVNFGAYWDLNRHAANIQIRWIDSYTDDTFGSTTDIQEIADNLGIEDDKIDSWTTVDAQYSYELPVGDTNIRFTIGARNLFNEDPPKVAKNGGYDEFVHNPLGRTVYGSVGISL